MEMFLLTVWFSEFCCLLHILRTSSFHCQGCGHIRHLRNLVFILPSTLSSCLTSSFKSHHQYYSNCNKIHTHAFPPEQSFLIVNVEYRLLNLQEKSNLFVLNEWSYPDWMTTINALQVYITVPCIHSAPLSLASVKQLHAVLTWAVGIKKSTRRSTPETTDSCFMISEHACNQEEKLFCHGVIREMLMWNCENVSKI